MAEDRNKVTPAREFLLGRLSEETRSRFEDSFFNDDELFEQIEGAEDELIDDYVRNQLSVTDRYYFERTLLQSPRIAERVRVAAVLAKATARTNEVAQPEPNTLLARLVKLLNWFSPTSVAGKFAYTLSGLVFVVGGTALTLEYLRLREASQKMHIEQAVLERKLDELTTQTSFERDRLNAEVEAQRAENARLTQEYERQLDQPAQSIATLALTLFSGGSRAIDEGDSFRLQGTPVRFQFNLLLEADDHQSYRAVVTTVSGKKIGLLSDLKSKASGKNKIVTFRLSSTRFTPDDYVVDLSGIKASGEAEPLASYNFRVLPKTN